MPLCDELLYRKTQRLLGEIQVAIKLALDIKKQRGDLPGLSQAIPALLEAKSSLVQEVFAMERGE
jgi:hypothetical protein